MAFFALADERFGARFVAALPVARFRALFRAFGVRAFRRTLFLARRTGHTAISPTCHRLILAAAPSSEVASTVYAAHDARLDARRTRGRARRPTLVTANKNPVAV